jgi:hypothetical protein
MTNIQAMLQQLIIMTGWLIRVVDASRCDPAQLAQVRGTWTELAAAAAGIGPRRHDIDRGHVIAVFLDFERAFVMKSGGRT